MTVFAETNIRPYAALVSLFMQGVAILVPPKPLSHRHG
jgi:hypothetical protein